jgi:hypothetical protein
MSPELVTMEVSLEISFFIQAMKTTASLAYSDV